MRQRFLSILFAILTIFLLTYLPLALGAKRILPFSDYLRFTSAVLRATLAHSDEDGGARALEYTFAALDHALVADQIVSPSRHITFPLPPYTFRQATVGTAGNNRYISFATDQELIDYMTTTLPQAGWSHEDQMGGGNFFIQGKQRAIVSQRYLLTTAIRELSISLGP